MVMAESACSLTAQLLAVFANVYRVKGHRVVTGDDLNPFATKKVAETPKVKMSALKSRFMAAGAVEKKQGRPSNV